MARRGSKPTWQLVLLLVLAALAWVLEPRMRSGAGGKPSAGGSRAATASYETFTACRLEEHRGNDGDSFLVRLPDGRVEQFRLYYVDAPESAFRRYGGGRDNHQRIREQAAAFGIAEQAAVDIGRQAKERVRERLGRQPFTLHTRWDDPFGDRRYHAFVAPAGHGLLDEELVREGLVRIHTKGAELPDGTPVKVRLRQLRELEREARQAGRGAWGMRMEN
jgi:endonuclease YncB( thermonuclease family)